MPEMHEMHDLDAYHAARLLGDVARRAQHWHALPPRYLSECLQRYRLADDWVLDYDTADALDLMVRDHAARGDVFLSRHLACLQVCRDVQSES